MSTVTYMRRVPNGLLLAPESDPDALDKYRLGEVVKVEVWQQKSRNSGFHRKFFALVTTLRGYWDAERFDAPAPPPEAFRAWVTVCAGYFEMMPHGIQLPMSISYASMEQADFERLYSAVLDWAIREYLPKIVSAHDINEQVENLILGFG